MIRFSLFFDEKKNTNWTVYKVVTKNVGVICKYVWKWADFQTWLGEKIGQNSESICAFADSLKTSGHTEQINKNKKRRNFGNFI